TERNICIGGNFPPSLRSDSDERIVCCIEYVGRNRDSIDDICSSCACVVVHCPIEPAVERGHLVVELTQALEATQTRQIILSRETFRFGAHPGLQLPNKVLLI